MSQIVAVLVVSAAAGFLALFLISGDLADRSGLSGPGRVLLAAGLGMGVIAITIKIVLVGILSNATETLHTIRPSAERLEGNTGHTTVVQSTFTGRWHALPDTALTPDGSPLRADVVDLGKRLFNDPRLSADGKVACRSCHALAAGGDDGRPVSAGIEGRVGTRNAPTVWNAAFLSRLFWDGRAASLEEQARGPLTNPVEMGMRSDAAVVAAVRAVPDYVRDFKRVFGRVFGPRDPVSIETITAAIASYERTLIAPDTRYDRFVRGEADALDEREIRGMALFAGLGCRGCHRDPTFSAAGRIMPAGVRKPFPIFRTSDDVRKYDFLSDRGSARRADGPGLWRVPSLRNVAGTAPYFHNGSVATLEEAVRIMVETQLGKRVVASSAAPVPHIVWDPTTRKVTPYRPAVLGQEDIAALVAFLKTLSNPAGRTGTPAS